MKRLIKVGLGWMIMFLIVLYGVAWGVSGWSEGKGPLNVNTANMEELQNVPGIDETLALNIVDFRNANGPFITLDELLKVKGMNKLLLDSVRDYLVIETPMEEIQYE